LIDSDPEVKLKKYTELEQKGIITIDEARSVFGFDPVNNGDKTLVDLNRIPLDSLEEYQNAKIRASMNKAPQQGGDEYGNE
ncbi:phage portal protein, partial [Staphylococcus caprae]